MSLLFHYLTFEYLLYIARISSLKSLQISQHLINNLRVQILARNHNFETSLNCCDIHSISKKQYQLILASYHSSQTNATTTILYKHTIKKSMGVYYQSSRS